VKLVGFDGDAEKAARLREALLEVARVFPEHVAKSRPPTWFDPEEIARNDQFDAIVRAHKKDRLALPIQALLRTGATYHNFDLMHARRLAWFVPTLLSAWLDRAGGDVSADDIERIFESTQIVEGSDWEWSDDETAALTSFFSAALDAALATPLPPRREPGRPLEDGVQVWSFHAPSVPLEVLRVAQTMRVEIDSLVLAWTDCEGPLALDHLVEAIFDPTTSAKHRLSHESVADRLGEAFFDATGERAVRLSKAEKNVRRWIARRAEWP
jgi:hypothetical protein